MDGPTLSGQILKGYLFGERIGTGSFGAVYRAVQATVDRAVAVKIILPVYANLPDFVRKFESEAQLVARLEHPHIVPLFDYWRDPDGAYLVMRMLPTSLRMILTDGPLPVPETVRLSEQIASALAFSHRQGVIHRDIKPDNILLDDEGNAYLSDFGLAEVIQASSEKTDGSITGSPAYMSPEQLRGDVATIQSDIYGLGVVLYEMLTGEHPYINLSISELIQKQLLDPLPPLNTYRPDLPETVNTVLQKATRKDRAERYADVQTLSNAFHDALLEKSSVIDLSQDLVVDNPYKGLRAFEEVDASDFFGRETLVGKIVASMGDDHPLVRFVAVVGPSGSGKSSVVQAGVIPALRRGALPNSDRWFIVNMVPSAHPIQSLETLLLSVSVRPIPDLHARLISDECALLDTVGNILTGARDELVLVVDQFEELFTLVQDEAERAQFLALIRVAVTTANSRIRVIVNLRADFYDRPLLYEGFGGLIQARTQLVLPLTESELERAITAPATNAGVMLEPNLVAAMLADVYAEPGALPLLQYALTEVFERRQGRLMTLQGYEDINRISGALARRADRVYEGLTDEQKATARQMFLRLVTLGEEGTDEMRRRASRSELLSVIHNTKRLEELLDIFGRHRLLSFDHEPVTREPTIEVAHEALLREWRTLRRWLEEGREDVIQQRRLARLADDWLAAGQDSSFLLRGSQLELVEDWLSQTDIALTDEEAQFVQSSIDQREARLAEEAARRARVRALEQRAQRFQRWFIGMMFIATVIATVLALIAFQQRLEAQDARREAEANAEIAQTEAAFAATQAAVASLRANELQSLALVTEAKRAIDEANPDLALALLLEASSIPDAPVDAENLLSDLVPTSAVRVLSGQAAHVGTVAISPDSTQILSGSDDAKLVLWD
ncbi:MAG: protein kinase, partial [Anaerolineae bacterium]|nr:protein kinase [Anaerolineae bacterium]